MAKNLVNGTNIVIEESGDNINMNLSSTYNANLQQKIDDSFKKNNIYSTEETVVGTWMGKPIYRKVITTTPTNTESNVVEHNILNVDKIWISDISFLDVGGTSLPVNYYRDPNTFIWAHINGSSYQYKISAPGWLNRTMYLTAEYTKTTDSGITN